MLKKLELYIKVRYTLIYLQTIEESRVLKQIENLARKNHYSTKRFNFENENNPENFLKKIDSEDNNTIFILQDFHRLLSETSAAGLKHIRILRNYKERLKNQNKIILITAPVVKLPEDIINDFIILNSELPVYDEIKAEIDNFLNRNSMTSKLTEGLKERIIRSSLGLTIDQINKILAKTFVLNRVLDQRCLDQIIQEKKLIIGKDKVLDFFDPKENMNSIGGLDNLKKWLKLRSEAFSKDAQDYGLPEPKGLLMLGVQGTGKSLTAKAVSSLWQLPLLKLDIGRVFGSYIGESENKIREAIKTAEAVSPSILWIDEIDKAFAGIGGQSGDSGTSARVFGTFISWMQDKNKPVFIVATANDVSKLPPELLRKGRFDEIFFVDLPNRREREEIFKIHLNKVGRDSGSYNIPKLVAATDNYTGAEIEQAIKDAMYIAFADDQRDFTDDDIIKAVKESVPLAELMKERIETLRSWSLKRARKASLADSNNRIDSNSNDIVY